MRSLSESQSINNAVEKKFYIYLLQLHNKQANKGVEAHIYKNVICLNICKIFLLNSVQLSKM